MCLTERFCSEQILFMPGLAEFPQATIPYSICDLKSELQMVSLILWVTDS